LVGTGSLFGFTAILGVISLVGVIVSHVIVLFDYIEGLRESGVDIHRALIDAGSQRLRPVILTTAATVLGLVPLAIHGGPLWVPLCLAQIGGLTVATCMTLVLVPTLYAVFVIDLQWITWTEDQELTLVQAPRKMGLAVVGRDPTTLPRNTAALAEAVTRTGHGRTRPNSSSTARASGARSSKG
jgi:hypothetical protein